MIRTYFNQKAAIWDEDIAEKDTAKLERMAERLNIEPGSIVLDVGTGTGVFLPFVLDRVGTGGRTIALDIAEQMLHKAQAKGVRGNVDYLQADITNIPLRDNIFDIVVCYSSFPHFQDKLRVLKDISRVMKTGGRLLICHTSSRVAINEIHSQIPVVEKYLIPDIDEMQQLLSAAGFTGISIEDDSDSYLASAEKCRLS